MSLCITFQSSIVVTVSGVEPGSRLTVYHSSRTCAHMCSPGMRCTTGFNLCRDHVWFSGTGALQGAKPIMQSHGEAYKRKLDQVERQCSPELSMGETLTAEETLSLL
jgi:hypothetical protein